MVIRWSGWRQVWWNTHIMICIFKMEESPKQKQNARGCCTWLQPQALGRSSSSIGNGGFASFHHRKDSCFWIHQLWVLVPDFECCWTLTWQFLAKILIMLAHFWLSFTDRVLTTWKTVVKQLWLIVQWLLPVWERSSWFFQGRVFILNIFWLAYVYQPLASESRNIWEDAPALKVSHFVFLTLTTLLLSTDKGKLYSRTWPEALHAMCNDLVYSFSHSIWELL